MRNFIETIPATGDGYCRVCDHPYSKRLPDEEKAHRVYHRRYLRAVDGVGAPVPRHVRQEMTHEGLQKMRHGETLEERVEGAELWLRARHHDHLEQVLRDGRERLDVMAFFTRMEEDGLEGRFADDVAQEMRRRYSVNWTGS
ncbi:hypothetical protein [Myxococcus sp. Y35]|uniref:hypothetical protein n=1 Tax=Pseudomyxococcus flavus TaxID=3115648 RepID=UPI003CF244A0